MSHVSSGRPEKEQPEQTFSASRRNFLRAGTAAVIAAGVAFTERKYIGDKLEEIVVPEKVEEEDKKTIEWLRNTYGIYASRGSIGHTDLPPHFVFRAGVEPSIHDVVLDRNKLSADGLSAGEARDVLHWVTSEVSKYPPELIKKYNIRRLYLVKNYVDGTDKNIRGGTFRHPDNSTTIILSPNEVNSRNNPLNYFENPQVQFHHELFHAADVCFGTHTIDDEWVQLNPRGKLTYIGEAWHNMLSRPQGCSEPYGLSDLSEDKATIVKDMIFDPQKCLGLCLEDEVYAKKVALLKARLENWSNGLMNKKYWQDLADGKVDQRYWQTKVKQ